MILHSESLTVTSEAMPTGAIMADTVPNMVREAEMTSRHGDSPLNAKPPLRGRVSGNVILATPLITKTCKHESEINECVRKTPSQSLNQAVNRLEPGVKRSLNQAVKSENLDSERIWSLKGPLADTGRTAGSAGRRDQTGTRQEGSFSSPEILLFLCVVLVLGGVSVGGQGD